MWERTDQVSTNRARTIGSEGVAIVAEPSIDADGDATIGVSSGSCEIVAELRDKLQSADVRTDQMYHKSRLNFHLELAINEATERVRMITDARGQAQLNEKIFMMIKLKADVMNTSE